VHASHFIACPQADIGYTPKAMLPLYVRNTLREANGTTAAGDQTQDVMDKDKRYTHYMGRPLNRFEPGRSLSDDTMSQETPYCR
jgi:hypothetical protein